ncbi:MULTISPECIES: LysR family transcriptional regulator [Bacillaceae]|uniref:LysR family transcriptional regulator n=1 Tax=Bacillaceae TaxID=186817 RepID=UPI0011A5127F|nr:MULTISPECIES: LysR family transcriptional regulator [Bacillaceae]MCM3125130.1 LysR family transcriptional regulator [Mesobacillus sp. MER 33]MCM3235110.1 LysR family transcriptional regulator [Mesobacillus sp. MER 48]
MNLEHLKTFIAAAKYESFSQAGKMLNLSQPAVSHQISQLETYYNKQLFIRANRKIRLSEAGKTLYEHGQQLLALNDKLESLLAEGNSSETIKIGCSNTIGECLISKMIQDIIKLNPDIASHQIQVTIGTSVEITDLLYASEIDLALVEGQAGRYDFISHEFYDDLLVLGVSPQLRVNPENQDPERLEEMTWLIREPGCAMRQATLDLWRCLNIEPKSVLVYNSNTLIKEGVKNGLGVAIFSKLAICPEVQSRQLIVSHFIDRDRSRPFYLLRKDKQFKSSLHERVWNFIRNLDENPNASC